MRELVKVLKNYALVRRELVAVVGVEPTEAVGYEKATENTVAFLLGHFRIDWSLKTRLAPITGLLHAKVSDTLSNRRSCRNKRVKTLSTDRALDKRTTQVRASSLGRADK